MDRGWIGITALAVLLGGCEDLSFIEPLMLKTLGGHVLDDRAWAVGSMVAVRSESQDPLDVGLSFASSGVVVRMGEPQVPDIFGGDIPRDRQVTTLMGMVLREGEFAVATGPMAPTLLSARKVDHYGLGVAYNNCPEFADYVFEDEPAFLEGASVYVLPSAMDRDGVPLVGHQSLTLRAELLQITGPGSVELKVADGPVSFDYQAVAPDEITSLEILEMPEKHGMEGLVLVTAMGRTATGQEVHGLVPEWSNGMVTSSVVVREDDPIRACFGDVCAKL